MWLGVALGLLASAVAADQNLAYSPPFYPSPWADGQGEWAEAYAKAKAFVSQLTLPEKVNLTTGTGWEQEACVGFVGSIERLGFEGLCLQDSPLGVRLSDQVSAFPAGVNVAATFSKDLAYARARAMAEEFRDKGVDIQLGPVIGPIGRTPYGGRNWEGFSPDPVVSGKLVAESIKGMQDVGVVAAVKHIIGNEEEHFRRVPEAIDMGFNITGELSSNIDDITMHELYLWPFADAVRAGAGSMMCSYQQINNSLGCQNSYVLNHLLKNELNFQGFVMTDWSAHHSGVSSALAGLDMSMPGNTMFGTPYTYFGSNLTIAVLNGTVPQWRVDDMAIRIMSAFFKVHRDAHKIPVNFNSWSTDDYGWKHFGAKSDWGRINEHVNVRQNHAQNIREVAAKSVVLLKNDKKALPLTGHELQVAVIGEDAGLNTEGLNSCPNNACNNGTLVQGWGSGTAPLPYLVTPYDAILRKVLDVGVGGVQPVLDNYNYKQIDTVLKSSDVALVFVNADSGENINVVDQNYGDRNNLTLWNNGDNLINHVASKHNNTIVVIHSVGPVVPDGWHENPNVTAVLWAGLPGQESGNGLADVLYGDVNPAGRSPFTWAEKDTDYGINITWTPNNGDGAPQVDFKEGIFIDYRHFDKEGIKPVWEFGHGLSYTSFKYSNLKVNALPVPEFKPENKTTKPAPSFGKVSNDTKDYLFPKEITPLHKFLYPFLNSTDLKESSMDPEYGLPSEKYLPEHVADGSAQPVPAAGGAPGGNPRLYDELYEIVVTIENTGKIAGDEVPQLYVSLGGENDAKVVLRDFDRIMVNPGLPRTWRAVLTRRDVSNWDPVSQNWVITDSPKRVHVGSSSRKLRLQADLPKPKYLGQSD